MTTLLKWLGSKKKWDWPISKKVVNYYDDHRNFHVEKFNLILFRVSKVAGTSLWQKSAEFLGYQDVSRDNLPNLNIPKVSGLEIEYYGEYFRAGFVRNPWDRLLSCYLQKRAYKRVHFFERNDIDPSLTFEEFVMKVCSIPDEKADQHFRSQYMTLMNHRGEFMLDFLGRFERIEGDYRIMANLAKLPDIQLSKTNKTDHKSYVHYYTLAMQKAVAERYQIDLSLFKYQYDVNTPPEFDGLLNKPIECQTRLQILKVKCAKMVEVIKRIQLEEGLKKSGYRYKIRDFFFKYSHRINQDILEPYDDHRNIYLRKQKLLFYKIPKVASTSLWKLSTQLLGKPYQNKKLRSITLPYIPFYELNENKNVYKVGFIRNPWDRLTSCFLQKKKYNRTAFFKNMGIDQDISFPDFVDIVCSLSDVEIEKHLRSQYTYLIDHTGNWLVDYVGRFEYFSEDLEIVLYKKGIQECEIPHANSSDNAHYQNLYTPELIEKVRKRYAIDIELFGYEFIESETIIQNVNIRKNLNDKMMMEVLEYKSEKLMATLRKMSV